MACRTPIDGLSDAEASSESCSDHSSDSEGKPDQDRPLAACFCCGHPLRKRAVVLLLSMVACQIVCMALPLCIFHHGPLRWAPGRIFNSCSGPESLVLVSAQSVQSDLIHSIMVAAETLVYYLFLPFLSLGMVQRRLELVERGFGQPLGAGMVAKTRLAVLLVLLVVNGYTGYCVLRRVPLKPWVSQVFYYSLLGFTNLVVAVIVVVGLARVCAAAEPSRLRAGSYSQAEAIWTEAVVTLRELCFLRAILFVSDHTLSPPLESICLFIICGFFQPEHPELCIKKQNNISNTSTSQIFDADASSPDGQQSSPGGQQSSASSWDKTVQSLFARSLEVEEHLEFFGLLRVRRDASGTEAVMPSYDPWRSTTGDVVRGAIIPLSQAGNCGLAYANYSPGATASTSTTLPDCMVSHTWSALFLDLVAAVVADALELDEYGKVAQRLAAPGGAQKLLQEVRRKSCQRYWICAFCVNQHAGICNGFGSEPTPGSDQHSRWDAGRRDTVSGAVFSLCSCSEPKYFDGPMCEMNKFDDMMGLLQHRQPNLRHLVAVDRRFELFSRAWCVAELVQSYLSNLPQTVLLLSNRALDVQAECLETYNFLATLTVLGCKASREEDRLQILAKIPDVHEFDVQLQAVIFGSRGLLRNALAGFDRVDAAARAARRAASAAAASEGP
ncbi:unnamed protein product [Polarella glacialis]|uniref:Uncharacterized protein n=1 Tax=Polarella glacialis TaxID=89957 RepID=A0A813ITH7_POLGL|nr:unnamed protein product [Polarella glacialis]